jgi:hypothetical protein
MTPEAHVPKLLEFAAKWITPVGVVILLLLQGQFVSRKEFNDASDKLSGRVEGIEKVLVQMAEAAKVNDRQDVIIGDHERRIRALEIHP